MVEKDKATKKPTAKKMNVYLISFVITIVVFFLGMFVGLGIERFMLSNLIKKTSSIESSIQEIELELLYFQGLNTNESCTFLKEVVRKTNNKLDIFADQLGAYSDRNILFTRDQVTDLKTKYTSLLIKDWLLQEKIKTDCGDNVVSVLYFYSTEGCNDCIIQGDILTLLKEVFKDKLMVFPLDAGIESDMVKILMARFEIEPTPTIVVNNEKYEGVITKEYLSGIICSEIPSIEECI